jgi:hypothetical protein
MPVTLISPFDESRIEPRHPAPRLGTLAGKTIGLLDISKPGGSVYLDGLERILRERYGVADVIRETKPTFAKPAPPEVIDRLRRAQVQAVIEALAD